MTKGHIIYVVLTAVMVVMGIWVSGVFGTIGIGIAIVTTCVMLLPDSDFIQDFTNNSRQPTETELELFTGIENRLRARAAQFSMRFPSELRYRVIDDNQVNAFAQGSKTIGFNTGAIDEGLEKMEALFAHEAGHLVNKDTLGMALIRGAWFFPLLASRFLGAFVSIPLLGLIPAMYVILIKVPYRFYSWVLSFTNHGCEYRADDYA